MADSDLRRLNAALARIGELDDALRLAGINPLTVSADNPAGDRYAAGSRYADTPPEKRSFEELTEGQRRMLDAIGLAPAKPRPMEPPTRADTELAQLVEVVKTIGAAIIELISWREDQSGGISMGRGPEADIVEALETLPGGKADPYSVVFGDDWCHRHPELDTAWSVTHRHRHVIGNATAAEHTHDHTGWSDK